MRFLFVKQSLLFPRRSGHDVHCYSMMRALRSAGHQVRLLTSVPVDDAAVAGIESIDCECIGDVADLGAAPLRLSKLQERFRSYWGIERENIQRVAAVCARSEADVVVVVGLEVLPYLAAVEGAQRIWYAADEWLLHHLSQVFLTCPQSWREIKPGLIKGLYERAFARCVDRVWVVSDRDARAARLVMGKVAVDVAPNGVDAAHYAPQPPADVQLRSCVFWGRLDFGPNIDALEWFSRNVWGQLRARVPDATFSVFGFEPTEKVRQLALLEGVEVIPDLPDLRSQIARHQVVVLPFVSGAGIKNKLLEAAAMAMPIVASPQAARGLRFANHQPMAVANRPLDWIETLVSLWNDPAERLRLGQSARDWVTDEYSWSRTAQTVLAPLDAGN